MQRYASPLVLLVAAPVLMLGAGCGRMAATTVVRADGTCTRTLKFAANKQDEKGGLNITPKLDDLFAIPSGPAWKAERSTVSNDVVCKATRTFKVGDTLEPDIVIKAGPSNPQGKLVVGSVSLKQISPGVIEYREVLKWVGEKPKEFTKVDPDIVATVRGALPASLATDGNVQLVSRALFGELWRMLFGPNEPIVSTALMHPDLAERRIMRRLRKAAEDVATRTLGDKLTAGQRASFVEKVVARAAEMSNMTSKSQSKASEGPSDGMGGFVPVLYSVKLPGKITATNGEIDGDEVYWAFYSMAAAAGDVELTATCEVGK